MKFIVLDDERIALDYLVSVIEEVRPRDEIVSFQNPKEALKYIKSNEVDVVFLDIQMPGIDGIELAKQIKLNNQRSNIVFVTGYSDYMAEAFRLDASDYLMKPVSGDQILHAINNLRYETRATKTDKPITITCFGNFEILIDGKPVKFGLEKTKELLAYLVHKHGARCSIGEILANLWEDEGHESYYRMIKKDLMDTFEKEGYADLIVTSRGQIGLGNCEKIDCDYFKWIENVPSAINLYHGEYMAQYSWAEDINALLEAEKYL